MHYIEQEKRAYSSFLGYLQCLLDNEESLLDESEFIDSLRQSFDLDCEQFIELFFFFFFI